MTTLVPRPPYTKEELSTLYPSDLELQQVQVILRHGERTPVNSRFKNVRGFSFSPTNDLLTLLRLVFRRTGHTAQQLSR